MNEVQKHTNDSVKVQLSESALVHITSYLQKKPECKGLRLSVKKTGCSGLSYVVDYVREATDDDIVQKISDAYWIYIDRKSYPYLKGIVIDYVQQGISKKLVFQNPNQTGQCGCGESFTVDENV